MKTAASRGAQDRSGGGVALDLRSADDVRSAATRMGGPVIVQQYVTEGAELLAGIVQDPVFGPIVAFGPGGVLAELIGSANFALAPLTDVDAEELLGTGKAARLVDGWRAPPPPIASLSKICCTGSRGSPSTSRRSQSSTSTRCWPARTAALQSTCGYGSRPTRRRTPRRPGEFCRALVVSV